MTGGKIRIADDEHPEIIISDLMVAVLRGGLERYDIQPNRIQSILVNFLIHTIGAYCDNPEAAADELHRAVRAGITFTRSGGQA